MGSNPTRGMDNCRECCVLSGRGLCDALFTPPEEALEILSQLEIYFGAYGQEPETVFTVWENSGEWNLQVLGHFLSYIRIYQKLELYTLW